MWEADDVEGFLAHYVAHSGFSEFMARIGRSRVNTDDRNDIEFGFARTVGMQELNLLAELRAAAAALKVDRPPVTNGNVDWPRFEDARTGHVTVFTPPYGRQRAGTLVAATRAHLRGDDAGFVTLWRSLGREPSDPLERRLLARHQSALGDEGALPYIARIAADDVTLATWLEALLRTRQRRPEAVDLVCRLLERLRSDPWLPPADSPLAVTLAGEVGRLFPSEAPRLIDALARPLELHAQDDLRRDTLLTLAASRRDTAACATVLSQVEPHVPWHEAWLSYRERCYSERKDPRVSAARDDLRRFRQREPQRFPPGLDAASGFAR